MALEPHSFTLFEGFGNPWYDELGVIIPTATEGTSEDHVRISWSRVGDNDAYNPAITNWRLDRRIYRPDVNGPDDNWEEVHSDQAFRSYEDEHIAANVPYEYRVVTETTCPSGETASQASPGPNPVGFRLANGDILGQVRFQGMRRDRLAAVEGVWVTSSLAGVSPRTNLNLQEGNYVPWDVRRVCGPDAEACQDDVDPTISDFSDGDEYVLVTGSNCAMTFWIPSMGFMVCHCSR